MGNKDRTKTKGVHPRMFKGESRCLYLGEKHVTGEKSGEADSPTHMLEESGNSETVTEGENTVPGETTRKY